MGLQGLAEAGPAGAEPCCGGAADERVGRLKSAILLAQTESDGRPAGAGHSPALRSSRPVDQPARFSQPEGPGRMALLKRPTR